MDNHLCGMVAPMSRPLRTQAAINPRTMGERIRCARITCGMSQAVFATAIGVISKAKMSKSLVSRWETGGIDNPNNANMLAIQAVTGFSMEWLVNGRGPQRVTLPSTLELQPLNPQRLARALAAALPDSDTDHTTTARVVAALYDILGDTPEIEPGVLKRFASTLAKPH